ncbi:MAG: DsbA family protein [bacterium]
MNTKLIFGIATVLLVAFLYASYTVTNPVKNTYFPEAAKIERVATNSAQIPDHIKGTGKRILTEYADLQCPACKSVHEYFEIELKQDAEFARIMNTEYTVVYKHFPLRNIHKNAQIAVQAAEAAGLQGKFYEFIDTAYKNQDQWKDSDSPLDTFNLYAKDLGVDQEQFANDAKSSLVVQKIDRDIASGTASELNSTPSFYIDGKPVAGFGNFEELKKIIIEESKKKAAK